MQKIARNELVKAQMAGGAGKGNSSASNSTTVVINIKFS